MTDTLASVQSTPAYRERLWPSAGVALFGWGVAASLALGVARVLGARAGVESLVILSAAYAIIVVVSAPRISVAPDGVRVGRALLTPSAVGRVRVLNQVETKRALGSHGDQTAFLVTRGWVPGSVIVTVDDLRDPHPYWQVSSRRPDVLAAAIEAVMV